MLQRHLFLLLLLYEEIQAELLMWLMQSQSIAGCGCKNHHDYQGLCPPAWCTHQHQHLGSAHSWSRGVTIWSHPFCSSRCWLEMQTDTMGCCSRTSLFLSTLRKTTEVTITCCSVLVRISSRQKMFHGFCLLFKSICNRD